MVVHHPHGVPVLPMEAIGPVHVHADVRSWLQCTVLELLVAKESIANAFHNYTGCPKLANAAGFSLLRFSNEFENQDSCVRPKYRTLSERYQGVEV